LQFVREVLALSDPEEDEDPLPIFYLVESRTCPADGTGFKQRLADQQAFESEFIGASAEECEQWEREQTSETNFIVHGLIAIADAQSAKDGTLLISSYQWEDPEPEEDEEDDAPFPPFGHLPPRDKANTWWHYRVKPEHVYWTLLDLGEFGVLEASLPYYGYKDRITDEHGIFDTAKARRIMFGEDPETVIADHSAEEET
jgi:hypothetical protein